ncbi:hypothetical protein ACP4OV_024970 [Aristida adscensionis]
MEETSKTDNIKQISDGIGSFCGVLITAFAIFGIWNFTRRSIDSDGLEEVLLMPSDPILRMSPFGRARRFSYWILALFFHTVNALLYLLMMEDDFLCLLMKGTCSVITLGGCIVLLVILSQRFTITKDFWIDGRTIGIFYMVSVTVAMIASQPVVLELNHIFITLLMNLLRFSCQESFLKFEISPFSVAILGIFCACLPFIPDHTITAYKVASFIIAMFFRILDSFLFEDRNKKKLVCLAMFLCCIQVEVLWGEDVSFYVAKANGRCILQNKPAYTSIGVSLTACGQEVITTILNQEVRKEQGVKTFAYGLEPVVEMKIILLSMDLGVLQGTDWCRKFCVGAAVFVWCM